MGFGGYLRANTAVDVLIGPFLDDSDGNTAETGLTVSQADVRLSKNGQNMAQKNDANACTHDEIGYYNCPLDTTDTNTEGQLTLCVHESGALAVRMDFQILSEAAWDSMNAAKDDGFMDVNIKTIGRADTQETEADNLESACSNYSVTRGLTGTALPAAAADAAGGVPISDAGGLDIDTLLGRLTADVATEAKQDTIDTVVDAIKAVTDNLPDSGALSDLATVLADTNELQGDWTNGGRLDLILDELTTQGDTNETKLDTVITDTNELQADWTNGGRLDLIIDELTTQGDTNETKIDTADTVVDAIKAVTDNLPNSGALTDLATAAALSTVDTVVDAIKVVTDLLANSAGTIVDGTVSHDNTAASTTVFYSDDITEATADHYKGRIVIFTSGALQNQATDITAYALESGEGKFTVTALTEAPADNVTFIII